MEKLDNELINTLEEEGYNPCPLKVVEILKTLVIPARTRGVLLDNCAGDGLAGMILAKAWNLKPFLVEPEPWRAQNCARRKGATVLCCKAENLRITGNPSVWYFNPPFDHEDPDSILERQIFLRSAEYAARPKTLGVLLLPIHSFLKTDLAHNVMCNFSNITIRRFPDSYFSDFQQIVVFGYGRSKPLWDKIRVESLVSKCRRMIISNIERYPLRAHEFGYSICEELTPVKNFFLSF